MSALREYRLLHMRSAPGGMGIGMGPMGGSGQLSPNSLVLPERLKSLPLLALGLSKVAALRGGGARA